MKRCGLVFALVAMCLSSAAKALVTAGVGCAPTAEAAVARLLAHDGQQQISDGGFRVVSVRQDPLRKGAWALVASCSEPMRPMIAVPLGEDASVTLPARVAIGERVAVIAAGSASRFELTGVARDGGTESEMVRVEMPRLSAEDNEAAPVIRCRVVRAGVVEVVR